MAKILLVEDGEMNRNMLGHRLERRGYTVASAADGQWVLAMIEVQPFAAILLEEDFTRKQCPVFS
jgi:CheY-like chemotaxis protein